MLLAVENLHVHFRTADGVLRAVDGVSLQVDEGQTLAIVGESGSGKSVTANSILRLIAEPPGRIAGVIRWRGADLLALSQRQVRKIRGGEIGVIFQEPTTSLNPVLSIGHQLVETLRLHERLHPPAPERPPRELLPTPGLPEPQRRIGDYPHLLSGGMQQRVMIALALAGSPKLLIADEPTAALDVTIQAQILELLRDFRRRTGAALLLITHDMGVVAEAAARVIVMYAGRKVEEASTKNLFRTPRHPYTRALLGAVPRLGAGTRRLAEINGAAPSLLQRGTGCAFASRCTSATEICRRVTPPLEAKAPGHVAACHHAAKEMVAA